MNRSTEGSGETMSFFHSIGNKKWFQQAQRDNALFAEKDNCHCWCAWQMEASQNNSVIDTVNFRSYGLQETNKSFVL